MVIFTGKIFKKMPFFELMEFNVAQDLRNSFEFREGENYFHFPSSSLSVDTISFGLQEELIESLDGVVEQNDGFYHALGELREHTLEHYAHSLRVAMMFSYSLEHRFTDLSSHIELTQYMGAGLLHDWGKVDVSLDLLHKRGRLNEDERVIMWGHNRYSYLRLRQLTQYPLIAEIGVGHHPRGEDRRADDRRGREISVAYDARQKGDRRGDQRRAGKEVVEEAGMVLALCDIYDALTSERSYKPAFGITKTTEIILDHDLKVMLEGYGHDVEGDLEFIHYSFPALAGERLERAQQGYATREKKASCV